MTRNHDQMVASVVNDLTAQFGDGDGILVGMAPGRVNLIGEYTDFNDGFVLPMTLDRGIYVAARARHDRTVRLWASQYQALFVFDIDTQQAPEPGSWPCYIFGVVSQLAALGLLSQGFDAVIDGNLALQAGLSSSAALEVAMAVSLRSLFQFELDQVRLVELCRRAEHQYAQVLCGVMDQFACGMGDVGHALFLDCRSLAYENVAVSFGDYRLLILNTGVKRALASSAYNERRAECDEALKKLVQNGVEAESLRDISAEQLQAFEHTMSDVIRRRAQHVISENQRVVTAVGALKSGSLEELGGLMIASHWSLAEDFAVSCEELDYLVESLSQSDSVLGARMTGAGFGGCAVAVVAQDSLEVITEQITSSYHQRFGLALTTMAPIGNRSAGIVSAA